MKKKVAIFLLSFVMALVPAASCCATGRDTALKRLGLPEKFEFDEHTNSLIEFFGCKMQIPYTWTKGPTPSYSQEACIYAADHCGADWYEQALKSAKSYLSHSHFSYSGLVDQLEYEGFTSDEANYGVGNCGADWYERAAKTAESYLSHSSFSRQGLLDQLLYEGFTHKQAEYGLSAVGY